MSTETRNGPSLEILKQQRDRDRLELEELRAENVALRARLGDRAPTLLIEVSRALLLGALSSDPLQAAQMDGDRVMRTNPTYPDPGASTRAAREHVRILHRNLIQALERFNRAAEHHWYPPRPPKEPQVRCCTRGCEAKDKRLPKYVGQRGTMIELSHCPKCGSRLVAA